MISTTAKANEVYALARKRARMDLEGREFPSRKEYRQAEAEIIGQILDGFIAQLNIQINGSLS